MSRITAKRLAKLIEKRWPHLFVKVESWKSSTDRSIGRLRWPGKGRTGSRLSIYEMQFDGMPETQPIHVHKNSETYRRLTEVVEWMRSYAKSRGERVPKSWQGIYSYDNPTWEQLTGGKEP